VPVGPEPLSAEQPTAANSPKTIEQQRMAFFVGGREPPPTWESGMAATFGRITAQLWVAPVRQADLGGWQHTADVARPMPNLCLF
jgi:hypothetical protein